MKEVPVLIAGGGPVGMTLAKTLASFGIECMIVEKNPSTTRHPKMDITNSRSMELFRKLGLSKLLRDVAVPQTNNFDVSWITSLSGHELHRFRYPGVEQAMAIIRERNDGSQPVEPAMRVSQVAIEPVLKRAIEVESLVDVRFGVVFEGLAQNADSVIGTVRNVETGKTEQIKCQYLVGCDGGVSQVRTCLDINYDGIARVAQLYMVHFRSDARDVLQPWGIAWHYQTSQQTMIAQNDRDIWTLHTFLPPDAKLDEIDPSALVQQFAGRPFAFETLVANPWNPHLLVAERYSHGRVFLAGDSAHQFIPTGGYGMNTGIGDAFDIGWKLAATLKGYARPGLLESYERERRPVGLRNCQGAWRHMSVRLAIAKVYEDLANSADARSEAALSEAGARIKALGNAENESYGVEMGYCYADSPVVTPEPHVDVPRDPIAYEPTTLPGARLPNVYLADGAPLHDKLGRWFSLLAFDDASADDIATAAARRGIPLEVIRIADPEIAKIYQAKLVLVRPDQHVCWRGNAVRFKSRGRGIPARVGMAVRERRETNIGDGFLVSFVEAIYDQGHQMTQDKLDWDNLRYFLAVARAGKLTAAARRLGQDHTTVGRRIASLEAAFRSKLFERRPEGYRLTEAGQKLLGNVEALESSVWEIERDLAGRTQRVEGLVRIGAPDDFGNLFLAQHIGELQRLHPGLKIELIVLPYTLSVSKREVDIAIGLERPVEGRLFVRRLTDFELRLYAARDYIEAHGPIDEASDLLRQTWIGCVDDLNAGPALALPPEFDDVPTPLISCSSSVGQLTAVLSGAGIGMLPRYVADRETSLVPVLPDLVKATRAYQMVIHADLRELPRVRTAANYIAKKVNEERAHFSPARVHSHQSSTPWLPVWPLSEAQAPIAHEQLESPSTLERLRPIPFAERCS